MCTGQMNTINRKCKVWCEKDFFKCGIQENCVCSNPINQNMLEGDAIYRFFELFDLEEYMIVIFDRFKNKNIADVLDMTVDLWFDSFS